MKLLFTVEDAFQITGRGCVLVPGLSGEPGMPPVKVGSPLRLELADGTIRETHVAGLEMLNFGARPRPAIITAPILLPMNIRKEDVPPGTKVFLLADANVAASPFPA
jgi:translation elongation factor EF-Tu-like GTPase